MSPQPAASLPAWIAELVLALFMNEQTRPLPSVDCRGAAAEELPGGDAGSADGFVDRVLAVQGIEAGRGLAAIGEGEAGGGIAGPGVWVT